MQKSGTSFSLIVLPEEAGLRLDKFLASRIEAYSRSALGRLILNGKVLVNESQYKGGYRVRSGDSVTVAVPPQEPSELTPEVVEFSILHEDDDILVLVKPPGLVVHPSPGHKSGTLAHGLLFHCNSLPGVEEQRPGIVHRLDKDTSGIMLAAKTDTALRRLTDDFRDRNIRKTYNAILLRSPSEDEGRIVEPIGRHPVNRKKMAVRHNSGRYAATRYTVLERFDTGMCHAELDLETGRTHQIRVHMASLGCPVAGDALYGGRIPESFGVNASRQLLHASKLSFVHPVNRRQMEFSAPLWPDMVKILGRLSEKTGLD